MQTETAKQNTDLMKEFSEIEGKQIEKLDIMISDVKRAFKSSTESLLATETKITKISKD
jgi:hypothetical protein